MFPFATIRSVRPPATSGTMLVANAFESQESQSSALDFEHFDPDRECPFEDAGCVGVLERLPWLCPDGHHAADLEVGARFTAANARQPQGRPAGIRHLIAGNVS